MMSGPPGGGVREHLPERPSWDCLSCGKPWPCDPAREELVGRLDRIGLAMYAWDRLEEAAGELPQAPVGELFERFLAWTRRPGAR
jgi:hypothetical protein